MNPQDKVQKILEWRECISRLSNDDFFNLIHYYLGEIKTPYNKHKLIEQLSGFMYKKENQEMLIKLLDENDVKILTSIKYIANPDLEKISSFFKNEKFSEHIEFILGSLEERLVIFRKEKDGKTIYDMNPHLIVPLEPYLDPALIVGEEKSDAGFFDSSISITPELLVFFAGYVFNHPSLAKLNGEIKKKNSLELEEIFKSSEILPVLQKLLTGMNRLHLVREKDGTMEIDWNAFEKFSELSFKSQIMYLCVASSGFLTRNQLLNNVKILDEAISFMDGKVYDRKRFYQIACLIQEKNNSQTSFRKTRFSQMLEKYNVAENQNEAESGTDFFDLILESAIVFGLAAFNKEKNTIRFCKNDYSDLSKDSDLKPLNVDSAFAVTLMPGLSTKALIPFAKFLSPVAYDVALTFEISRQSIMKGFDSGVTKNEIIEVLKKYSSFDLPQNLYVSIDDWASSYESAALYKGYVLKVSEDKVMYAQNNPAFSSHIKCILAPGVFLLDFISDDEAMEAVSRIGLDFVGKVRKSKEQETAVGFPEISLGQNLLSFPKVESLSLSGEDEKNRILEELKKSLDKIEMTFEQKEGLLSRIERRIVVDPVQLRPETVKFELTEATGMDYTRKIHLLDSAISKSSLVEIRITGEDKMIFGLPKGIVKSGDVSSVVLETRQDGIKEEKEFEIARISYLRKVRTSL